MFTTAYEVLVLTVLPNLLHLGIGYNEIEDEVLSQFPDIFPSILSLDISYNHVCNFKGAMKTSRPCQNHPTSTMGKSMHVNPGVYQSSTSGPRQDYQVRWKPCRGRRPRSFCRGAGHVVGRGKELDRASSRGNSRG